MPCYGIKDSLRLKNSYIMVLQEPTCYARHYITGKDLNRLSVNMYGNVGYVNKVVDIWLNMPICIFMFQQHLCNLYQWTQLLNFIPIQKQEVSCIKSSLHANTIPLKFKTATEVVQVCH